MTIREMREGQRVAQVLFCKQKSEATAKNGKNYYSLKLQDKTGGMDGKVWDLTNAIEHFDSGDFIFCDGEVKMYLNQPQLTITRIRRATSGEYDAADFFPTSDTPADEMYAKLMRIKDTVKDAHIKKLLDSFFEEDAEFIEKFKMHSAAKAVHHNFVSGLLEHTLRVTELCEFYCKQYPMLHRDLTIAAAMFHDIGKIKELSSFPKNDYTDEGQLIGHIVISYSMVKDRIEEIGGFPERLKDELLHCILSHHGELEYGSPKKPAIIEALAVSHADDTDAKLEIMIEELGKTNSMDFIGLNKYLGTNIRRTSLEES